MRLASFDLEIAKQLPMNARDLFRYAPLGISCAAVALSDGPEAEFWSGEPQLSREKAGALVGRLADLADEGYTIVTWNGCGFDFRVLAEESRMVGECARLAMAHVDLMLLVTFNKGYFLSLEAALHGAGLGGKLKRVRLLDGTILEDMQGAMAPRLWAEGETGAVLEYLEADVVRQLQLAKHIQHARAIRWRSKTGNPQHVAVRRLLTVQECFDLPEPDTSWMTDPPRREQFVAWMKSSDGPGAGMPRIG